MIRSLVNHGGVFAAGALLLVVVTACTSAGAPASAASGLPSAAPGTVVPSAVPTGAPTVAPAATAIASAAPSVAPASAASTPVAATMPPAPSVSPSSAGDGYGDGYGGYGGTASATPAGSAGSASAGLGSKQIAGVGTILVGPDGRALYTYKPDGTGTSSCNGGCAQAWPPLAATTLPALPAGFTGTVTVFARGDGTKQVAYNGHPLYEYTGDSGPGVASGQGAAGVWFVVTK